MPAEVDTEGFQQSKCFRIYYIFLSYDSYIIYKNIMVTINLAKPYSLQNCQTIVANSTDANSIFIALYFI